MSDLNFFSGNMDDQSSKTILDLEKGFIKDIVQKNLMGEELSEDIQIKFKSQPQGDGEPFVLVVQLFIETLQDKKNIAIPYIIDSEQNLNIIWEKVEEVNLEV